MPAFPRRAASSHRSPACPVWIASWRSSAGRTCVGRNCSIGRRAARFGAARHERRGSSPRPAGRGQPSDSGHACAESRNSFDYSDERSPRPWAAGRPIRRVARRWAESSSMASRVSEVSGGEMPSRRLGDECGPSSHARIARRSTSSCGGTLLNLAAPSLPCLPFACRRPAALAARLPPGVSPGET